MLSLPGRPVLSFVFERVGAARRRHHTTSAIWLKVSGCTPHKRLNSSGLREESFSLVNFSSHSLVLLCRLTYHLIFCRQASSYN